LLAGRIRQQRNRSGGEVLCRTSTHDCPIFAAAAKEFGLPVSIASSRFDPTDYAVFQALFTVIIAPEFQAFIGWSWLKAATASNHLKMLINLYNPGPKCRTKVPVSIAVRDAQARRNNSTGTALGTVTTDCGHRGDIPSLAHGLYLPPVELAGRVRSKLPAISRATAGIFGRRE
jgi:hypothetical protein